MKRNSATLNKQYNKFAHDYSEVIVKKSDHSRKIYYKHFNFPLKGRKILDAGCGDGTELLYCMKRGAKAYGIDTSEKMIQIAKKKSMPAKAFVANFSKLPFSNSYFDVVISKHALQSIANVE